MRLHGLSKDAWKRYLPESVNPKKTKFEHYDVVEVGLKYNMIDLNAAMGIVQLSKIEKSLKKRKKNYDFYIKRLKHLPMLFQKIDPYPVKHAHHLFTIRINSKKISFIPFGSPYLSGNKEDLSKINFSCSVPIFCCEFFFIPFSKYWISFVLFNNPDMYKKL